MIHRQEILKHSKRQDTRKKKTRDVHSGGLGAETRVAGIAQVMVSTVVALPTRPYDGVHLAAVAYHVVAAKKKKGRQKEAKKKEIKRKEVKKRKRSRRISCCG